MHLLVTDVLACPRCGPEQGLIVLADSVLDRRVRDGRLGCANCRGSYPIRGGAVALEPCTEKLRPTPCPAFRGAPDEVGVRIAALLGLSDASALILLVGTDLAVARAIARRVEQTEVIVQMGGPGEGQAPGGVSVLQASGDMPLRRHSVHGVALVFDAGPKRIRAAASMVGAGGRLVVCTEEELIGEELERSGMRTLLFEDGVLVAERSTARRLHRLD